MSAVQLQAFHAVATHGSYVAAARALGVSQPTVSEHVHALERRYRVRLLRRSGRGVALTAMGLRLLETTTDLDAALQQAERLLTDAHALHAGHLHLATDSPPITMSLLAQFHRRYPRVELSTQMGSAQAIVGLLDRHEVDAAVVAQRPEDGDHHVLQLGRHDLLAVVPLTAPLARRASIEPAELLTATVLLRERGSQTREALEQLLSSQGLTVTSAIELDGRESITAAARAGLGLGVIGSAEWLASPDLAAVPIRGGQAAMSEYLVAPAGQWPSAAVGALFALARDGIDNGPARSGA